MSTLYWILTLCKLQILCAYLYWTLIILLIPLIIFLIFSLMSGKYKAVAKSAAKKWTLAFVIAILGATMIPTQKEMLLIFGVGGTIDYINSNETLKKLPDRVIEAADAYLKSVTENNK